MRKYDWLINIITYIFNCNVCLESVVSYTYNFECRFWKSYKCNSVLAPTIVAIIVLILYELFK